MDKKNHRISDELLASFIDGTCSPLEKSIVDNQMCNEELLEVLEISSDCINEKVISSIDPIDMHSVIDKYMTSVEQFSELKSALNDCHIDKTI